MAGTGGVHTPMLPQRLTRYVRPFGGEPATRSRGSGRQALTASGLQLVDGSDSPARPRIPGIDRTLR